MMPRRLRDLSILGGFGLLGVSLMYFGYFSNYSPDLFAAYLAGFTLFAGCYVVYYGLVAPPEHSIYSWLVMFLIFPKKPLTTEMEALLNVGLGFRTAEVSMYQILDIVFSLSVFVAVLVRRSSISAPEVPRNVRLVYLIAKVTALWTLVHFGLVLLRRDIDVQYHNMVMPYWQLIEGLILFRAASCFIKRREHVETLLSITIYASLLLVVEFVLAKAGLLPESVEYYSLNYRGAFRSVVQSGDLFVSQILILGACSALYFYNVRRTRLNLALVFSFIYVVLETYNRGSLFALFLAVLFVFFSASMVTRLKLYAVLAAGAAFFIVYWSVYGSEAIETIGNVLDVGNVKTDGYFSAGSTVDRFGAMWRAFDAFLYSPWFGVGPGNIKSALASANLPGAMSGQVHGKMADFYELIRTGGNKTNAHNLFINELAEYGIVTIPFAILTTRALVMNYLTLARARVALKAENETMFLAKVCCYAALFGFAFYYLFQAEPLLVGVFFIWIRITVLKSEDWETKFEGRTASQLEIVRRRVPVGPMFVEHS